MQLLQQQGACKLHACALPLLGESLSGSRVKESMFWQQAKPSVVGICLDVCHLKYAADGEAGNQPANLKNMDWEF